MEPQQHTEGPYATAMIPRQPSSLERPRPPERRSHSRLTQSQIGSTRPQTVSKVRTQIYFREINQILDKLIVFLVVIIELISQIGYSVTFYVEQASWHSCCKIIVW